jgi:hypothetical protein
MLSVAGQVRVHGKVANLFSVMDKRDGAMTVSLPPFSLERTALHRFFRGKQLLLSIAPTPLVVGAFPRAYVFVGVLTDRLWTNALATEFPLLMCAGSSDYGAARRVSSAYASPAPTS